MADSKLSIVLALTDKATKPFRSSMSKMQKGSARFLQSFRKNWLLIAAAITGALIVLTKFSKSVIIAADKVQQYNTRLKVLLGSMEEGKQVFTDMTELASQVPKTYDEIMASATDLSAVVRGGSEEIKQLMPIIVDLSAGTGMSVREVTGQMIRMYSAGAAAADMFRERGVSAALGFQAGVSTSSKETMKVITDQWEDATGKFVGASEELKKTWTGATSMMQDAWFQLRAEIGLGIIESEAVNDAMQSITETIAEMAKEVKKWRSEGGVELFLKEMEIQAYELALTYGVLKEATFQLKNAFILLATPIIQWQQVIIEASLLREEIQNLNVATAERILQLEAERDAMVASGASALNFAKIKFKMVKTEEQQAAEKAAKDKKLRATEFKEFTQDIGARLSATQGYYSMLSKTIAMAAAENKELAWLNKAIQIGQVAINTASAIMKTLAIYGSTPVGWGMTAAVAAMGATQAAIIASQEMHKGGMIRAHTGMSLAKDEVPIIAQTGEGILSRRGMTALGGTGNLNRLNTGAAGGGTSVSVIMENVSFQSEDDVEDVMARLSDLIAVKTRSTI